MTDECACKNLHTGVEVRRPHDVVYVLLLFLLNIAADIPYDHWKQAQLSLSFGRLGFRSLSYHSCAAFISS